MKQLDNKVALITGGGQGIGRAAAEKFAGHGARVIIVDKNSGTGEDTAAGIRSGSCEALFVQGDVSINEDVNRVFEIVESEYGKLHVFYNNASIFLPADDGKIADIKEETWDRVVSVNLKSVYLLCRKAIPLMKRSGGGSIINTASSAGLIGVPGCDAYTAAKGAVIALTRSLAVEYGRDNIRVNCIAPAAVKTPMLEQSSPAGSDFDEERFLALRAPLRRYGETGEIADIALFLASGNSSYINGAVITADGGITINGDLSKI